MPSRTQITRHDCVEGWSCIGKWKGVPLGRCSGPARAEARSALRRLPSAPTPDRQTLDGSDSYYESIDLVDAFHPQTILAYEMNGQTAAGAARRAAAAARRAPARLQDGEIRDADRGGRQLRQHSAAATAASGKTSATSGTPGFRKSPKACVEQAYPHSSLNGAPGRVLTRRLANNRF